MELTQTQVAQIGQLSKEIRSTGLISQQQVVSLEACVGYSLVTKDYPINTLSETPTRCFADEVADILDASLRSVSISDLPSHNNYREIIRNTISIFRNLSYLVGEISGISEDVVARLTDTKYTAWYDKAVLYDIAKDKQVQEVLYWNQQYMLDLILLAGGDHSRYDYMMNEIERFRDKYKDTLFTDMPLTLITMLLDSKPLMEKMYDFPMGVYVRTITLTDLRDLIRKAPVLLTEIDGVIRSLEDDMLSVSRLRLGTSPDETGAFTAHRHQTAKLRYELLQDPASLCVLNVMLYFKK